MALNEGGDPREGVAVHDRSVGVLVPAVVVTTLLGANDGLVGRAGFLSVLAVLGVTAMMGWVIGGALSLIGLVLRSRTGRATSIVCVLIGGVLAVWLAQALGVFYHLSAGQRSLGALALALGCGAGGAAAALCALILPGPRQRGIPRIRGLSLRWRIALTGALLVGAGACVLADRYVFAGLYEEAHHAERLILILCCIAAACAWIPRTSRPALERSVLAVFAVSAVVPPLAVSRKDSKTIAALTSGPVVSLATSFIRAMTDVDGDGHSALLGGGDCAPFDSAISPAATEVPANGVDDNCWMGDAPMPLKPPPLPPMPAAPAEMSILLITMDAVRADHMSGYGHGRPTTPRIDAWARDHALRFERAYTSGGSTRFAIPSMLRGVYPRRLEWTPRWLTTTGRIIERRADLVGREALVKHIGSPDADPRPSLARVMRQRGLVAYAALAVGRGDDYFQNIVEEEGGFEPLEVLLESAEKSSDAAVAQRGVEWLQGPLANRPFFLWLHLFGAHMPSTKHEGVPEFGDSTADRYDHEIAFVDGEVGKILEAAQVLRRERKLAILLTSDHGEALGARLRMHGTDHNEGSVRIPLYVSAPGGQPGVSQQTASLVDVMPTILALTSTPRLPWLDGISLLDASHADEKRAVLSEFWVVTPEGKRRRDAVAAFDGARSLRMDLVDGTRTLHGADDAKLSEQPPASLSSMLDAYIEHNRAPRIRE